MLRLNGDDHSKQAGWVILLRLTTQAILKGGARLRFLAQNFHIGGQRTFFSALYTKSLSVESTLPCIRPSLVTYPGFFEVGV